MERVALFDEYDNEPVEMEVGSEQFPLEDITNYDTYMVLEATWKIKEDRQSWDCRW